MEDHFGKITYYTSGAFTIAKDADGDYQLATFDESGAPFFLGYDENTQSSLWLYKSTLEELRNLLNYILNDNVED